MQKYLQDDLENTQSQFINQEIVALSERGIGKLLHWNIDGGAREILMVLSQKFRGWKKGKKVKMNIVGEQGKY